MASTRRCVRSRRSAVSRSSSRAPAGSELVDTDGNRYLDYVQSWGASILGHAHPVVVEAVQRAAADGTSYGAPTAARGGAGRGDRGTGAVGREGAAGVVGHRSRHDRGAPGTRRHGPAEDPEVRRLLPRAHRRAPRRRRQRRRHARASRARRASPRAPSPTRSWCPTTTTTPSTRCSPSSAIELAAVLVEPIAANMGLVAPAPGFLEGLRRRCTDAGALLVFDEVITGFRVGSAARRACTASRPTSRCSARSSAVGSRSPRSAGAADVMDELAPLGPVYQAGTLSGNPLATAAGLAVLSQLDDDAYADLTAHARRASPTACATRSTAASVKAQVTRGHAHRALLRRHTGHVLRDAQAADHARYAAVLPRRCSTPRRASSCRRVATRRCS